MLKMQVCSKTNKPLTERQETVVGDRGQYAHLMTVRKNLEGLLLHGSCKSTIRNRRFRRSTLELKIRMFSTVQHSSESQTDLSSGSLSPLGTEQFRDEITKGLNPFETKRCIHAYMNNPHTFLYCMAFNFAEIKSVNQTAVYCKSTEKKTLAHSSYNDNNQ